MKIAKQERREPRSLVPMSRAWSPFRQWSRLHDEIDRLLEEPFGSWSATTAPLFEGWSPAVDIYEDKDNVRVKAELPGMRKEDIEVSVFENTLHISGERKEETEHKEAGSYRTERYFGRFQRTLPLPEPVQAGKVHAEYRDGILTITCPKTEEAKRSQIEVKVE